MAKDAGLDDTARLPALGVGERADRHDPRRRAGRRRGGRAPGTIDAFGEQLVSGAVDDGDVLVILGATAIVWAVTPEWVEVDGVWTVPHTTPGKTLIGGPSNAGGLFMDWVRRLLGDVDPDQLEAGGRSTSTRSRSGSRTCGASGCRCTTRTAGRRCTTSTSGWVRPRCGGRPPRARRSRCATSSTSAGRTPGASSPPAAVCRARSWMQALADGTGLPVDVVAVPQGAALGTAYLARVAAGLEADASDAGRWARTSHRVEPDDRRRGRGRPPLRALPRAVRVGHAVTTDLLPDPPAAEIAFTVISVDDHLVEPRHLFEGRMPAAPRRAARRT